MSTTSKRGPDWPKAFLTALAETGIVAHAARVAGVATGSAHGLRKRRPEFAEAWREAVARHSRPAPAAGKAPQIAPLINSKWRPRFLAELALTSNVAEAARKAGIDTATVYKARRGEPAFYRAWQDALAEGYDNLEMEMVRRLREGEPTGGATDKARRKFDNAVAFRLLTAHREAVGRQKGLRANEDEDAILASINAKLEKMRERHLAIVAEADDAPVDASLRGADDGGE